MRHQSSESYWVEPLLGHKQYVFYVPGIFFPLCIGDNARDDFPSRRRGTNDSPSKRFALQFQLYQLAMGHIQFKNCIFILYLTI
jgi:hypothetical protein